MAEPSKKPGVAMLSMSLGKLGSKPSKPKGMSSFGALEEEEDHKDPYAEDEDEGALGGEMAGEEALAAMKSGDAKAFYDAICAMVDMHTRGK